MLSIDKLFDEYSLRARLLPTLLAVLPAAAIVALLFPKVYATYVHTFESLGVVAVGLFFFAHVIRQRGRALETQLYEKWGGIPTTAWLRHRDNRLDPITKARYHRFLERKLATTKMASPEEEQANSANADQGYGSAVKWLLEFTRDRTTFPLVFAENVNYGFRRNTYAARPLALGILLILVIIGASAAMARIQLPGDLDTGIVAALIITLVDLVLWVFLITETWVKDAADAYARALLAACDKQD